MANKDLPHLPVLPPIPTSNGFHMSSTRKKEREMRQTIGKSDAILDQTNSWKGSVLLAADIEALL